MRPGDFALYDVLDLAATAVDEAESGRPALAEAAWMDACFAASGLFASGSTQDTALGVVLEAARPGFGMEVPDRLWRALDAASLVVLLAMDGRTDAEPALPGAYALAAVLEADAREALMVILAGARRTDGTVQAPFTPQVRPR